MKYWLLLFIAAFGFASKSMAIDYTPAAVPKNLHVYTFSGSSYVDLVAHGCSGYRYYLSPDHKKYDTIVGILMAAQIANRKVVVRFSDCINGSNPQGEIVGVYLK